MPNKKSHHPKANHPWRRYANKINGSAAASPEPSSEKKILSPYEFLSNLIDAWETYQIPSPKIAEREYVNISKLPHSKQVEWLVGFLKKYYLEGKSEEALI